jgi:outer membrane receptor protein involved in Fe transport
MMAAPVATTVAATVATTLVTGPTAGAREHAITALLAQDSPTPSSIPQQSSSAGLDAVILEGLGASSEPLLASPTLQVVRIAPGCLCCDGNLVLRVTLNRLLRQRPQRLFIGLARSEHLDQLRSWLQDPPYDQLLALNPVVNT